MAPRTPALTAACYAMDAARRRELKDIRTERIPSDPALYRVTAGSQGRAATRWLRTEAWKKERAPRI